MKTLSYRSLPKIGTLPTASSGLEGVITEQTSDKKPYYCDGATWVDLSASGSGSGLTYTIVATSGSSPSVNTVVRVNSVGGSFTITLPSAPATGSVIGVFDVANKCDINPVTISRSGVDTIEGATILSVNVKGAYVLLVYDTSTLNWKIADTYAGKYATTKPAQITTNFPGSNATPLTGTSRYYFTDSAVYTSLVVGLSSPLTAFTITVYKNGVAAATCVYSSTAAYTSSSAISLSVSSGDYITIGATGSGPLVDLVVYIN